jgi:hypothetical protein
VKYQFNGGRCDEYDFSGNKGGPNGVPVKNIDYKRLITLTLRYQNLATQTIHVPAFGHAPGDNATAVYSENILTGYSTFPPTFSDPTMGGKIPGLSSVAALDEPLSETDTFCWVSPAEGQTFTVGQEIEVSFRLFPSGLCPGNPGTPIRDKTASLSLDNRHQR